MATCIIQNHGLLCFVRAATLSSLRHTTGDATAVGRCRVARLIPTKEGYDHLARWLLEDKIFERPSGEKRERTEGK